MKKTILFLTLLLLTGFVTAQKYEKNIISVRGGMNVANMTVSAHGVAATSESRIGFHIGVADEILLSHRLPLYLETGLGFSSRGGKENGISIRPMYIQVPVLFNYHFNIKNIVTIQPFAGVYYGFGIAGKAKQDREKVHLFSSSSPFSRSDLGVRLGAGVTWQHLYFGLSYDIGCTNLLKSDAEDYDTRTGYPIPMRQRQSCDCFTLTVGYKF